MVCAGHDHGARGTEIVSLEAIGLGECLRACCCGVEVCESQPLLCDLVDVGGANFTTKTTNVGKAEVVGDNDEEIGAFWCHCQEG
jgi:hypothetical protein